MNNILNILGIDSMVLAIILMVMAALLLILLILVIVMLVKHARLKKRLAKFTVGRNGTSLEKDIFALIDETNKLKATTERQKKEIRDLYKRLETTFQKIGLVKYDAFQQMGGKLSFSLALLDENNNGFILNSVHSTEGCYSYTKEINAGVSALTLGKEEEEALRVAMKAE